MEKLEIGSEIKEIPSFCLCPITGEVMKDPVSTIFGQCYEKEAILEWFERGNTLDPLTGVKLPLRSVIPILKLKESIDYVVNQLPLFQQESLHLTNIKKAVSEKEEQIKNLVNQKMSSEIEFDDLANNYFCRVECLEKELQTISGMYKALQEEKSILEDKYFVCLSSMRSDSNTNTNIDLSNLGKKRKAPESITNTNVRNSSNNYSINNSNNTNNTNNKSFSDSNINNLNDINDDDYNHQVDKKNNTKVVKEVISTETNHIRCSNANEHHIVAFDEKKICCKCKINLTFLGCYYCKLYVCGYCMIPGKDPEAKKACIIQ